MIQKRSATLVMNEAFLQAESLNDDKHVKQAIDTLDRIHINWRHEDGRTEKLFTHTESVELVAKLGIFLNGDTQEVRGLLNKIP